MWAVILVSVIAALFLIYVFVLVRPRLTKKVPPTLLREYAHRGLYGGSVPENSLSSFELAVKEGTGVELDVQLSKDGEVYVFHDENVIRMTGEDRLLREMTSDTVNSLRLSGTDLKIPKFTDVLKLIDGKVPVLVELKGESLDTSLCDAVAPILLNYSGPYIVESFNPFLIRRIKKLIKNVIAGQLYTNACRDRKKRDPVSVAITAMAFNFISRPDFIAYNKECRKSFPVLLTTKFFRAPAFVWTVNGNAELSEARSLGEHAIFERVYDETGAAENTSFAYFAGGCFWCVTPSFAETGGVLGVTAGFSDGDEQNPSYEDVKKQKTGHRETVRVEYDKTRVGFGSLIDVFLANTDPFDGEGQFIDRGRSYTLAIYYTSEDEKRMSEKKIAMLEEKTGRKAYISVEPFISFFPAGEEHQDYYLKHPDEFAREIESSGRNRLNEDRF